MLDLDDFIGPAETEIRCMRYEITNRLFYAFYFVIDAMNFTYI